MKLLLKTQVKAGEKTATPVLEIPRKPVRLTTKRACKKTVPPSIMKTVRLTLQTVGRGIKSLMLYGTTTAPSLKKAHVKAYQRTSQSGQAVMVKEHDDKRRSARSKGKSPRRAQAKPDPDQSDTADGSSEANPSTKPGTKPDQPSNHEQERDWLNQDDKPPADAGAGHAFQPTPPPTSEDEVEAWLDAVMQEPDMVQAIQANQSGTHTDQIHKRADGSYTPERSQIHEAIIASMLNPKAQSTEEGKPHAVILMGCPGAGKTSTLATMTQEYGVEFTTINADDVKAKLPEYTGANQALVHEESSDIAEGMLFPRALQARHNLIMDITGSNGDKVKQMVEQFHNQGYEISIAYAHLPAWKAATREVDRFRSSGRFVPPTYVVNKVDGNPETTYEELKHDPRISHWRKYNNDVAKDTQAPLQEQGQRQQAPNQSSQPLAKAAVDRRAVRGHGGIAQRQDSERLPGPLPNAYRLHAHLTKSLVYLDADLASPDLEPVSRGVLLAERLRTIEQLNALTAKLDEVGA